MRLKHFEALVRHAPSMAAARFWLAVDPDGENGLRTSRVGFASFGKAGMLTPVRYAHMMTGCASLLVGTIDTIQFIAAGCMPTMPIETAFTHGMLHTTAALFSLPRFRYVRDEAKPWRGWLPTAVDASMWPSFVFYAWYTAGLLSDYTLPADQAFFPMTHPAFIALTHICAFFAIWQAARAAEEDMEAQKNWMATVRTLLWMTIGFMPDAITALYFTSSEGAHAAYNELIAFAYPDFTDLKVSTVLGIMFTGNLMSALASAKHHNAVTEEQIGAIGNFFAGVLTIAPIYVAATVVADGQLVPAVLDAIYWFK